MSVRKAFVVGINKYSIRPLNSCVNDATEMAGILEMREYNFDVTTLLDDSATRRQILSGLGSLFASNAEFILFYFAGHGVKTPFSTYLVSVDTDPIYVGIDLDHVRRLIQRCTRDDTAVVILLDCCHAGAASARNMKTPDAREIKNTDIETHLVTLGTGKVVLAACRPDELAFEEPSLSHGAFTHYLLQGLYGDAADAEGKVTIPNLYDHVSKQFENVTGQTPVFKGDIVGRIVLGEGLTPRERSEIATDEAVAIEAEAQKHVNEYIQAVSTDFETWKVSTYKDACSMLTPKLHWFERQVTKYPKLQTRSGFRSAYSTAQSKLADLGNLVEDLNTKMGVVKTKIGSGTFGTVWQIKSNDGQDLAYKVYHPTDMDKWEKIQRFKRGYNAMEQLDHPNIVKVHNFTECPVGFVMDFIPGPNLRDFAPTKPDPADILLQLLTVAETLNHAHSRGVIHRDVKPENILMCWQPEVSQYAPFLTDFDLAWFSTATQFTKEGFGSLIYAAPEQLGKPKSSAAHAVTTDVYAFGQLCFFFVCRRDPVPVLSDNSRALSEEVGTWRYEEPAHKIVELFEQCTQQRPQDRIQDFRTICDYLFEISQLLSQADHSKTIGFGAFARQLAFAVIGMSSTRIVSDTSFYTTSRQIQINIGLEGEEGDAADICLHLVAREAPIIQGAESHKAARDLINQRIDVALKGYRQVHRQAGTQGPFETYILIKEVPLNIDGVEVCRQILMRAVDCIERR
jgi:eukaryotic-like serine/threonine-protein kinase